MVSRTVVVVLRNALKMDVNIYCVGNSALISSVLIVFSLNLGIIPNMWILQAGILL